MQVDPTTGVLIDSQNTVPQQPGIINNQRPVIGPMGWTFWAIGGVGAIWYATAHHHKQRFWWWFFGAMAGGAIGSGIDLLIYKQQP